MKRKVKEDDNEEIWLITYADLITLLLCFFIILYASAALNKGQWEKIRQAYKSINSSKTYTTTVDQIKAKMDSIMAKEIQQKNVTIDLDDNGVSLGFANSSLYNLGEAELTEEGKQKMSRVVEVIQTFGSSTFIIDVEGHTDDNPISNEKFSSNWELSVIRATNVVRFFVEKQIPPQRLKVSGYGDTKPLVPNRDSFGKPIPGNQARNRRVLIRIHY